MVVCGGGGWPVSGAAAKSSHFNRKWEADCVQNSFEMTYFLHQGHIFQSSPLKSHQLERKIQMQRQTPTFPSYRDIHMTIITKYSDRKEGKTFRP